MLRRSSLTLGILAIVAAACTGTPADPSASAVATSPIGASATPDIVTSPSPIGAYDPEAPLEAAEQPRATFDSASLIDLSYASPGGGRVSAWMVVPDGPGPFAGLVYLHGSETDRDDFVDEAVAMASGGAVSILIDAPFARSGAGRTGTLQDYFEPESEASLTEQTVVDVQRAFDLLAGRPDIDPARIGFIGHSWGASLGAVVAARDPRPSAFVLITGRPSWTGFLVEAADSFAGSRALVGDEGWQAYLDAMAPYDAVESVGDVSADRLYLQFGRLDDVVIASHVDQWRAAIQPGVRVDIYADAGHALDAAATADRAAWLADRLGMDPITPDALADVGLPDRPTPIP